MLGSKLKMAKTALAYAKKASYIGKKVVVAVKAGGDDPSINRQLAAVMAEANAMNVPKDVVNKNIKRAMDTDTANYSSPPPQPPLHSVKAEGVALPPVLFDLIKGMRHVDATRRPTSHEVLQSVRAMLNDID